MRTFVTVIEAGSFTAAADKLQLSDAAVSRHIAVLEDYLGARVLDRTTRRHRLTEIGQICYERYSRVLTDLEETQQLASAGTVEPRGTLRVTSPTLFWILRVAPILPEFMKSYPQLKIQVNLTERAVDLIEEGYDVALQFHQPVHQSIVSRQLVRLHRCVCASPEYLERAGIPQAPQDLERHKCLLYSTGSETVTWQFSKNGEPIEVTVHGSLSSSDAATLRSAALAGMGILRGPLFLIDADLKKGALVRLLSDYDSVDPVLCALYSSRRLLPAKIRVFLDFLIERLR